MNPKVIITCAVTGAGDTVGIRLIDHVILGTDGDRWISLRQRGAF